VAVAGVRGVKSTHAYSRVAKNVGATLLTSCRPSCAHPSATRCFVWHYRLYRGGCDVQLRPRLLFWAAAARLTLRRLVAVDMSG
jgi:hypothetical protein